MKEISGLTRVQQQIGNRLITTIEKGNHYHQVADKDEIGAECALATPERLALKLSSFSSFADKLMKSFPGCKALLHDLLKNSAHSLVPYFVEFPKLRACCAQAYTTDMRCALGITSTPICNESSMS